MLYSKHTESQVLAFSVRKKYKHQFTVAEEQLNEQHVDTRGWTRNKNGEIVASPPQPPDIPRRCESHQGL
jgi:hypothetical protein